MSATDEYLANNAKYAKSFTGPLPLPPSKHVAVVACMDARQSLRRIEASPFVTKHESLRGFVFDVATGRLDEITP